METIAEVRASEYLRDGKIKPENVKAFILAYNLACSEIVEAFDDDCVSEMVSDKAECHALGNPITIHADGAYKGYKEGIKDTIKQIKYLFDCDDVSLAEPEIQPNDAFESDYKEYEKENPDFRKYLTDSTYFELMDWYDFKHGIETSEDDCASDEAHEFAEYVWVKILGRKL
jgi:hypothetical protein